MVQFDLLSKCGLLAHTSAAFLKNCCTEKLLVACGSYENLEYLGIKIDKEVNNFKGELKKISTPDSKVEVWVIPTNEELLIARDTLAMVEGLKK